MIATPISLNQYSHWPRADGNFRPQHLKSCTVLDVGKPLISSSRAVPSVLLMNKTLTKLPLSLAVVLGEKDSGYCVCQTPCNLTRYNKELSMVKIPSKTSAKYLEKKFNKSEKYIS